MFKIEKGLPAPNTPANVRYPFGQMEVGDSFYCSEPKAVRGSAIAFGKRNAMRFASRREGGGVRIWRVA